MTRFRKIAFAGLIAAIVFFAMRREPLPQGGDAAALASPAEESVQALIGRIPRDSTLSVAGPPSLFENAAWRELRDARLNRDGEAADSYLRAFLKYQSAQPFLSKGDQLGALSRLREALAGFEALANDFPEWKVNILEYRKAMLSGQISRIETAIKGA